jgi:hypothetical protein
MVRRVLPAIPTWSSVGPERFNGDTYATEFEIRDKPTRTHRAGHIYDGPPADAESLRVRVYRVRDVITIRSRLSAQEHQLKVN